MNVVVALLLACGSGVCASAAALIKQNLVQKHTDNSNGWRRIKYQLE